MRARLCTQNCENTGWYKVFPTTSEQVQHQAITVTLIRSRSDDDDDDDAPVWQIDIFCLPGVLCLYTRFLIVFVSYELSLKAQTIFSDSP